MVQTNSSEVFTKLVQKFRVFYWTRSLHCSQKDVTLPYLQPECSSLSPFEIYFNFTLSSMRVLRSGLHSSNVPTKSVYACFTPYLLHALSTSSSDFIAWIVFGGENKSWISTVYSFLFSPTIPNIRQLRYTANILLVLSKCIRILLLSTYIFTYRRLVLRQNTDQLTQPVCHTSPGINEIRRRRL